MSVLEKLTATENFFENGLNVGPIKDGRLKKQRLTDERIISCDKIMDLHEIMFNLEPDPYAGFPAFPS